MAKIVQTLVITEAVLAVLLMAGVLIQTPKSSGLGGTIGGGGDGINYVVNPSTLTVTNNLGGTITGDATGIRANTATIFNSGTISAPSFGGTGIVVDTLILTNYATASSAATAAQYPVRRRPI